MGYPVEHDHNMSQTLSTSSRDSANDGAAQSLPEDPDVVQISKPLTYPSNNNSDSSMTTNDDSTRSRLARELSPAGRPQIRSNQRMPSATRSRRGSQDLSPSRGSLTPTNTLSTIPSAAAVQRALSATRIPHLQPNGADSNTESSRPERFGSTRGDDSPQWPTSPRLKSPPPSSRTSIRKVEPSTTQSQIPKFNPTPVQEGPRTVRSGVENEEMLQSLGYRSTRGASTGSTLEPVAEGSVPTTPSPAADLGSYMLQQSIDSTLSSADSTQLQAYKFPMAKEGTDSGNESGSGRSKAEDKEQNKSISHTNNNRPTVPNKRSFTSLNSTKYRPGAEPSSRTMTVETETVSSIPQVSLGVGAGERGTAGRMETGGSIRLKPSNETIRPKKEKKRASRKTTSLNTGTVSSKADIFEAKVASAVDEATSSDSDETFVYESNPPDHGPRQVRHHSRTPSTTSMASQADGSSSRFRSGQKDNHHSVAGKRSMKFTNSAYNNNLDGELGAGSTKGTGRGTGTPRHHHIGRYGRGGHASLFDNDSPFTQAGRAASGSKSGLINSSRLSRPSSPRVNGFRNTTPTRKGEIYDPDFDDEAADDERTPLVGSVRINRSRHARRPNSASLRQIEYFEERNQGFVARFGPCIIVTFLLLILLFVGTAFIVALTKPLTDVSIKHIQNVLASEQEIILDLDVRARNPNLFAITVSDLNVDIFAKSGYVRSSVPEKAESVSWLQRKSFIKNRRNHTDTAPVSSSSSSSGGGGVDEGTDPIDDPEADPRTMLLGRVYDFDSPLVFEASPMHQRPASAIGQIRLQKPGNKTEQGGTERWERVLQHPFELTVRGNIRYQLPLSSRFQSAPIQGTVKYSPEKSGDDDNDDDIVVVG